MIEAYQKLRADGQGFYWETYNDDNGEIGLFDTKAEVEVYAEEENLLSSLIYYSYVEV